MSMKRVLVLLWGFLALTLVVPVSAASKKPASTKKTAIKKSGPKKGGVKKTAPKKKAAPHRGPLVVIDPGHGGSDQGAKVGSAIEKKLAMQTAVYLKRYLSAKGMHVVLTRSGDETVALDKRSSIANKTKCHLFVSLHFNAHSNKTVQGIEVFYYNKGVQWRKTRSKRVADKVLKEILGATKSLSRGVKHGNYHVIRETKMPAILVEGGFITNHEERQKLQSSAHLKKLATAIGKAVHSYFYP